MLDERSRLSPRIIAGGVAVLMAAVGLVVAVTTEEAPPGPDTAAGDGPALAGAPAPAASAAAAASAPSVPTPAAPDAGPPPAAPNEFSGQLEKDQTVTAMLQRHGITAAQVHEIVAALREIYDFRDARPGATYALRVHPESRAVEHFRFEHGPLDVFEVTREGGKLTGGRVDIPVRTVEAEVGAEIRYSLYRAMQRAGEHPGLVAGMVDVFAWDIDFYKDTRAGDRFKVVVEKVYKEDTFIRYGRILAAEYAGTVGSFRTFWFEPVAGQGGYYLQDGQSARKTFLATPLKFTRISSGFGKRKHPILGYTKAHTGVDYAAPRGTPVWAMAAGKVTFAGRKGPNGNLVVIQHDNGLTSYYAHLDRIAKGVKPGKRVDQKEVIGTVGTTGRSTGPHLHFAVKQNGQYINPQKLKMTRDLPVAARYRKEFEEMVEKRIERLAAIVVEMAPVDEADEDDSATDEVVGHVDTQ